MPTNKIAAADGKKVPRRSRASELSAKRSAAAKKGWSTRREKKAPDKR